MRAHKRGLMHFLLIGLAMILAGCTGKSNNGFVDGRNFGGIVQTTKTEEEEAARSTEVFSGACYGVILNIDTEQNIITILDLVTDTENEYTYSGATYIMDKYGKDISISQLSAGDVVEGGYDTGTRRLIELQKSKSAWVNQNVSNFTIDRIAGTMRIGSSLYEYKDNLVIVSDGQILESVDEISNQDELIVQGRENTVYSVIITRGHGYVTLMNTEDYVGGLVMVGSQIAQKITKDMVIEVPEGEYILEITKNGVGGRMDIRVTKNRETKVNVSALKGEVKEQGSLYFDIEPENARLYIDNKETDYSSVVKLYYGAYKLRVEAEGYVTYTGDLVVSQRSQNREIRLGREEAATEAESESSTSESDTSDGSTSSAQSETKKTADSTETGTEETRPASAEAASETAASTPTVTTPTVTTPTVTAPTVTAPTVTTPAVPVPSAAEKQSEGMGSDIRSEKIDGYKIHVEAPVGAAVYFDGEYVGIAPVSFDKISGEHTIIFKQNGYEPKTYTVTISSDKADSHYSYPALVPNSN